MVATPAIRNLIREGKVHQIYSAMQAGGRYGMQTMDMSLAAHVKGGRVTQQMAFELCHDAEELQRLIGSHGGPVGVLGGSSHDLGRLRATTAGSTGRRVHGRLHGRHVRR